MLAEQLTPLKMCLINIHRYAITGSVIIMADRVE